MEEKKEKLEKIRHSLSHLMTMAVLEIFPEAKLGMGPAIENGFYQDYDLPEKISEEILPKLEKRIRELIAEKIEFLSKVSSFENALNFYKEDPYKTETIEDVKKTGEKEAHFYDSKDFHNLCKGPHVTNTSEINPNAFKLTSIAGAYWKGDEKNKMLTRIYGLAFETKEELDRHLEMLEEAKKRDHRKIGKEMDLFSFHPDSPGMVHWHEKGMAIWNELEKFGKTIRKKYGSTEIKTPQMAKNTLWKVSGHWDHYKDDMFVFNVEKDTYCLKPMDCPFNINIYNSRPRSYKDLPIRYTEIGRVFRNEKSGELNGLFRVREITQDDSHIFFAENQVEQEIINLLNMIKEFYTALQIKPKYFLSTRPDNFIGETEIWEKAEQDLKNALDKQGLEYGIKEKDGAFYGPKIDVDINDVLDRSWQVATIQLDFQLPDRFNCKYIDKDGKEKTPVMIHAAIFGSFERMIGILIEHFGAIFPLWLAPVQIKILSVSDKQKDYVKKIHKKLMEQDFRVEVDLDDESLGKKIRKAKMEKVPYLLIIGDKELEDNKVTVESREKGDLGQLSLKDFIEKIKEEIKNKK